MQVTSRVLYIGGWGRSGSTLLDRLLGQVDGTLSVGEMRDVWQRGVVENRLCGCGRPFLECPHWGAVGRVAFGGWDQLDVARAHRLRRTVDRPWFVPFLLAPRLLPRSLRDQLTEYVGLVRRLYAALDEVGEGALVVDSSKIPSYALVLRRAGVQLRVLHLVRDSRGVVHSWRKEVRRTDATSGQDLMLRYGVVAACVRYTLYNLSTQALRLVRLPYLRLRYEDVTRDPAGGVRALTDFAGVHPPQSLLSGLERGRVSVQPTHTVDGNPRRLTEVGEVAIRPDDAWRSALAPAARLVTTALTAPLLRHYGYLGRRGAARARRSAAVVGAR